jgi:hypothetical protein
MTPPPDADPAGIREYAASLRVAATRLDDLADFALARGRVGEWTGEAATAYEATSRAVGRECDIAAATLHRLADRVDRHADVVARLLRLRDEVAADPGAAADVQARLLTEEQAMCQAFAEATEAARGPSAADRHRANLLALERDLSRLGAGAAAGRLDADEERHLAVAEATAAALARIEGAADPVTGRPVPACLYLYDPTAFDGDGRVAVVAGDLDTADDVAVVVPGLGTDGASAAFQADRALAVHQAARHLDPGAANATMAWIGYDAPDNLPLAGDGDVVGVLTDRMAGAGGRRLSATVAELRAGPNGDAHLSVIGYSYGSTTAGLAASGPGLAVDDLVLVGSPGAGRDSDSAADTGLDGGHVWVLRNSHDPVALLGGHGWADAGSAGLGLGDDPAGAGWGATRLQAEAVTRGEAPWADHTSYFDHDTESLGNIAHVVAGEYDDVTTAPAVRDPWWAPPVDPERDRLPGTRPTLP